MLLSVFSMSCIAVRAVIARSDDSLVLTGTVDNPAALSTGLTGTLTETDLPTGSNVTYITYVSTQTISPTGGSGITGIVSAAATSMADANRTGSSPTTSSSSVTLLVGGQDTTSSENETVNSTSTSASAIPTNTQPCNGYPELCTRKYSNVTEVAAHNSPFVKPGNAGSNQQLGVVDQLNDGIRMLQGQTHYVNDTLYYCHTSCDLLNVGTVENYLKTVAGWVRDHPYNVVTILIGNGDFVDVEKFVAPIQNSGLRPYLYEPPKIPMALEDWPTLSYMILTQKRVVIFMDYKANQTAVPYILDEFSQLWETPFSPTNVSFPCTVQRPPGLQPRDARNRLYMANHNLNVEVSIAGISLLVPDTVNLNRTNNVTGAGSLGQMSNDCISDWGRPPSFLLVDYYNIGDGSVFEVAARANNVTYSRKCCGMGEQSAAVESLQMPSALLLAGLGLAVALILTL